MKLPKLNLSRRGKITAYVMSGVIVGLGILLCYTMRAHTYLGDDPSACVNCHIMAPYYATWQHSSHGRDATCNDCHVPHSSVVAKYAFKAQDGIGHVLAYVTHSEHQVPMAKDHSAEVIMDNCIRCHTQLNQEFVSTGRIDFMQARRGEGKACWDCHRDVPHGKTSLSGTPGALVPYPNAPQPKWLKQSMSK